MTEDDKKHWKNCSQIHKRFCLHDFFIIVSEAFFRSYNKAGRIYPTKDELSIFQTRIREIKEILLLIFV